MVPVIMPSSERESKAKTLDRLVLIQGAGWVDSEFESVHLLSGFTVHLGDLPAVSARASEWVFSSGISSLVIQGKLREVTDKMSLGMKRIVFKTVAQAVTILAACRGVESIEFVDCGTVDRLDVLVLPWLVRVTCTRTVLSDAVKARFRVQGARDLVFI